MLATRVRMRDEPPAWALFSLSPCVCVRARDGLKEDTRGEEGGLTVRLDLSQHPELIGARVGPKERLHPIQRLELFIARLDDWELARAQLRVPSYAPRLIPRLWGGAGFGR